MNKQQNIEFKTQLCKLKKEGIIKRIGPAKGGHWEVKNEKRKFNYLKKQYIIQYIDYRG